MSGHRFYKAGIAPIPNARCGARTRAWMSHERVVMRIRHSIELAAPAPVVYQLFRQPDELPRLLNGAVEVTPDEPSGIRSRVVRSDAAVRVESELVETTAHRRIAWRQPAGPIDSGRIDLVPRGDTATRLDLELVTRDDAEASALESVCRRIGSELQALQRLLATLARARRREALGFR